MMVGHGPLLLVGPEASAHYKVFSLFGLMDNTALDRVTNNEVIKRLHTELHFRKDMWRRKMEFAGHVLRGSSGNSHLCILEGKVCGKRLRGRPRLTWTDVKK